jgi:hypothetical protein
MRSEPPILRSESPAVSKRDVLLATAVTVATLAFFVVTLRPDVGGTEDSAKFQFVGRVLGTSHSPGYPFYAMATWAFSYVPIGNLAYRINLFSAVCGALCCLCIFLTARRIGVTRLLSVAAALAAATGFPVWSNSITAEVYTLAAALSGLAVYWVIAFAQTGATSRLYAACAVWAMGFGNHVTIAGILPAALAYGVYKNRDVLKPRIAITAAAIGIMGVLQYAFIAIRTLQGAPYLEARATTVMGVFDVIIARDVSWARFYQAQSAVAAIEVPMLLNGLRVNMGTIPIVLVAIAIVLGFRRRNPEVMLITGAAAGTLAFIANLWGDVVGFITPVCVQLWPLAALGLQWLVSMWAPAALTAAGIAALILPVTNFISIHPRIEALRTPGEGPGVRALYQRLPANSAIVTETYWLARLVNYMHFSGEVSPDPNPKVLDNDVNDVRAAVAEGREVYSFEGATHWLNAQGMRFELTPGAREPFEQWLPRQPKGTLIVAATSGRLLPFEWLPPANRSVSNRPSNYGSIIWELGSEPVIDQQDQAASASRVVGAEGRALNVSSSDDGLRILWGDDVVAAADRGMVVATFNPAGVLTGQWTFSLDEKPGVQLAPTPFVLRGERACEVLRPGQALDVTKILADGIWLATAEGRGTGRINIETSAPPAQWRHRLSAGRGDASIDGTALILTPTPATRSVFRFSMPPEPERVIATLAGGGDITAVRVCESEIQALPASGALEVTADRDSWFGAGWHMAERGGTQRFRWSQRESAMLWRMDREAPVRLQLRMRPASANGTTIQATINSTPVGACTLAPGAWTDCRFEITPAQTRLGINTLTLTADSISPAADRPGDPRELSFVMQASRIRTGL